MRGTTATATRARPDGGGPGDEGRSPTGSRWLAVVLFAALALPLLVALWEVREPRWYPAADMSQVELRVRDVFSTNPPLIGLGGRFGELGPDQGSHPGPLAFYALAPVHRLLGDTAWALQAGGVLVHLVAIATLLLLARRRGGVPLLLGTALLVAVLLRSYGMDLLLEPWTPYQPLLWWLVFLLAVWSVTCGDLKMLPLAAVAGSFCVQTNIPYAGLVGALEALALGATAWSWWGPSRDRAARPLPWVLGAGAATVVLWLPPLVEQLQAGGGNLTKLYRYFGDPTESVVGLGEGIRLLLVLLDPVRLLANSAPSDGLPNVGSTLPGALLVLLWASTALAVWRFAPMALRRLHIVLAVTIVVSAVSLGRVIGIPWNYLSLWTWGVSGLLLLATTWAVGVALDRYLPSVARTAARLVAPALGVAVVVMVALGLAQAESVTVPDRRLSRVVAGLVPDTLAALEDPNGDEQGGVPGGGRRGRYLVRWTDQFDSGFPAYGVLDELERAGYDVGMDRFWRVSVRPHRVLDPSEATAEVHYAVGPAIDAWRARPDAVEVAWFDRRSVEERAEYRRLRTDVVDLLERAGLDDLARRVDDVATVGSDPRVSEGVRRRVGDMTRLGQAAAVFVAPPSTD